MTVEEVVAPWAVELDAFVVVDPRLRVSGSGSPPTSSASSPGDGQRILVAHDVSVVETRPSRDGPFLITVRPRSPG